MATLKPFEFNKALVTQCAQSCELKSASIPNPNSQGTRTYSLPFHLIQQQGPEECHELFSQHQKFYNRSASHSETPGRLNSFIQNVLFVYNHNQRYQESSSLDPDSHNLVLHYDVTINQFSDLLNNELPFSNIPNDANMRQAPSYTHTSKDLEEDHESLFLIDIEKLSPIPTNDFDLQRIKANEDDILQNFENILSSKRLYKEGTPILTTYNPNYRNHSHHHSENGKSNDDITQWLKQKEKQNHPFLGSKVYSNQTLFMYDFNDSDDDWSTYMDWATADNPDGVVIVHTPTDQGSCGSCWSIAAIGSLEANAARNVAMDVFYDHLSPEIASISSSWSRNDTSIAKKTIQSKVSESSIKNAVQIAQIVEKKAFDRARLSIQELIDCDTKYNQGCIGGNPVMALNFIHKYGIVSSAEYPYTGIENEKCQRDEMDTPIASTNSWGILKSKDEDSMEFALRHIGPICVGFDGSENSFLAYSGGIYDSNKCSNHPNHAMLITGYGQELDKYGEIIKYWIARNSWSTEWGEQGYVRIKRTNKKKSSGVCGIARNPSLSVGGYLIDIDDYVQQWQQEKGSVPLNEPKLRKQFGNISQNHANTNLNQNPIHGKKSNMQSANLNYDQGSIHSGSLTGQMYALLIIVFCVLGFIAVRRNYDQKNTHKFNLDEEIYPLSPNEKKDQSYNSFQTAN